MGDLLPIYRYHNSVEKHADILSALLTNHTTPKELTSARVRVLNPYQHPFPPSVLSCPIGAICLIAASYLPWSIHTHQPHPSLN